MTPSDLVFEFDLTLPEWVSETLLGTPELLPSVHERMNLVLQLARRNFENDTGGPFAAAVFELISGKLISVGVNRVVPSNCSSAHAEIMALSLAQRALGTYDLGGSGRQAHQLVVNWRPCAMCFGALPWAGIRSLVIAGSGDELEALTGFDEGPIHPAWANELERRGIEVIQDVLRQEAWTLFRDFAASGRAVYNARRG
jgi:tRNA(Arg) A34 adenosine deaminase TadA